MTPTTAQPVGAQIMAQTAPSMGQWSNQLVQEAGTQPEQLNINPNDILSQSANYSQLSNDLNTNLNYQNNPQIANLKQAVTSNIINQYNQQMNGGYQNNANSQIQAATQKAGVGNIFQNSAGAPPAAGQASLASALGQGGIGANTYSNNIQNAQNQNLSNLVNSQYQNYTPSGQQLEDFTLGQQAQQVANNNAWTQNLENAQGAQYNLMQGDINNMANSVQSVANENAAASNQASAANLSFVGGLASSAASLGGSMASGSGGSSSGGWGVAQPYDQSLPTDQSGPFSQGYSVSNNFYSPQPSGGNPFNQNPGSFNLFSYGQPSGGMSFSY